MKRIIHVNTGKFSAAEKKFWCRADKITPSAVGSSAYRGHLLNTPGKAYHYV